MGKQAVKPQPGATKPVYPKIADIRMNQIHFTMEDLKVDGLVVTYLPNIRYLINFSGSAGLLFVTFDDIFFITDDRYEEQIKTELFPLPNLHTFISRDPWDLVRQKKLLKRVSTLAFEADRMTYADAVEVRNKIRPIKFKPSPNVVERFTQPKSPEELESIKLSCETAEKVYQKILKYIKPGVTEKDIANEICYLSRKFGSQAEPFDIIVVSGPRGALVHGQPGDRAFKNGDIILMDFGCKINGFCSDITRTVALGKATKEQKQLYKLLVKAKDTAIDSVRPGMNGKAVDAFARDIIAKEGFGDFFQHSLGHGVGIEVHENPIITFRRDDQIVPENSVLAIEPGVYLPEKYGMRVEDCCVVTRSGGKKLTNAPAELPIIG